MNGKSDRGVMEIPNSTNGPAGEVAFRDAYRANGYFFPLRAVSEREAAAYRGNL